MNGMRQIIPWRSLASQRTDRRSGNEIHREVLAEMDGVVGVRKQVEQEMSV